LQLEEPKAASVDGDSICETCHKIDFKRLLKDSRDDNPYADHSDGILITNKQYSTGCKLCSLIFRGAPVCELGKMFWLRVSEVPGLKFEDTNQHLMLHSDRENLAVDADALGTVELKLSVEVGGSDCSRLDPVFCRLASDVSQCLECAQPVQRIWDYHKARLWLDVCVRCHEFACEPDSLPIPAMNLIDCEEMVIVKASPQMPWLALSYVWGINYQTEDLEGYRAGSSLSLVEIPRTIRDAIVVTLQLEYRFLWVDEYCIDQNDEIHRKDQIDKMDRIYRGADLTVVAAAGMDKMYGLPGVGPTTRTEENVVRIGDVIVFSKGIMPHIETRQSKWFTRAW
jgi:hypothetical protein